MLLQSQTFQLQKAHGKGPRELYVALGFSARILTAALPVERLENSRLNIKQPLELSWCGSCNIALIYGACHF